MNESLLRDLISLNINKLKSDLTLLEKEQYIPNELGTRGFIDLYAKDGFGNHVLIEIKRSNAAAREALHEVNKYVEGVKKYFGAKDTEITAIIASTEWSELIVPFSRFAEDTTFSLQGYRIILSDDGTDFSAELVQLLPISQGRFISPWHNMNWYGTKSALESGIHSIQLSYQEKGIDDYIIVKLYVKNETSSVDRVTAMRSAIAQMSGVDESEVSLPSEIPVHEYIAYSATQLMTKERCLQILSRNDETLEEAQEILSDMEENEALSYLHESVEAMEPRPQSDYYEIGYAAKLEKVLREPNCKILNIVRNGSFLRNALLSDETIISELCGNDGSSGQKFKKRVYVNNTTHVRQLKNEIASCMADNPVWKSHILRIIEEVQVEFPDSEIDISIFNPSTGVFTIYYAITKEDGALFLPTYYIIVRSDSEKRMYYGALEKNGTALTFPQILDKYYEGDLMALLLSVTWGGKEYRDTDVIEDLGLQYRSFRCDIAEGENVFFRLEDDKWRSCERVDIFTLFSDYLESNDKLVHQIIAKIHPLNQGSFFGHGSISGPLEKLADIDSAKTKNCYYTNAPIECDICKCSLEKEKYMIDGKLKGYSQWVCMCADCFRAFGEGISVGLGQLYQRTPNGWLLVGGSIADSEMKEF